MPSNIITLLAGHIPAPTPKEKEPMTYLLVILGRPSLEDVPHILCGWQVDFFLFPFPVPNNSAHLLTYLETS